jgi:hypothetical protein
VELAVLRARLALEKAHGRQRLLREFTRPAKIKHLESAVAKLRSSELALQATWELQASKIPKLERQIAGCTMVAPRDGKLRLRFQRGSEERPAVRMGQRLFEIVPLPEAPPQAP